MPPLGSVRTIVVAPLDVVDSVWRTDGFFVTLLTLVVCVWSSSKETACCVVPPSFVSFHVPVTNLNWTPTSGDAVPGDGAGPLTLTWYWNMLVPIFTGM